LPKRNPSLKIAGRNFGGVDFCKGNPSRKIAGRNFGGIFFVREILPAILRDGILGVFFCKRNLSRNFAGKNVAEQEFRIIDVGWNMGIVLEFIVRV
jgi:hypothetical protein